LSQTLDESAATTFRVGYDSFPSHSHTNPPPRVCAHQFAQNGN
jgi:hypothetical protein